MDLIRQKLLARLLLLVLGALGVLWLSRIDYARKISTNVIDLVPSSERSPEIALLRTLADERQARVMLFALRGPSAPQAASRLAADLRNTPHFAEAIALHESNQDILARFVRDQRFDLLLPTWLAEQDRAFTAASRPERERSTWLAERIVSRLDAFLLRPEATAFQPLIPEDPLLLIPSLVAQGQLFAPTHATRSDLGLVWARLTESPLSEAGQLPVFASLDSTFSKLRATNPEVTVDWTGVNRFAATSKARIRSELDSLNTLALAAVLILAVLGLRHPWRALHLLPILLFSILGGWVATTLLFERLHILVFVLGALLTGVAVDYGFYLYIQPAEHAAEHFAEKLRRLLKPLLVSCATTVAGFLLLLFSELPLIRQMGVFVSAGLVSALVAAVLYLAQLDRPNTEARPFASRPVRPSNTVFPRIVAALLLGVALIGPWRLRWDDNIRELDATDPPLIANDQNIRALFGETDGRSLYFTHGPTLADARAHLGKFHAWHQHTAPDTPLASLGLLFPTEADHRALPGHLAKLADFELNLRAALERQGYTADAFAPFFASWRRLLARSKQPAYEDLGRALQSHLIGPLGMLFFQDRATTWFVTLATHSDTQSQPPPELHTIPARQLETLNTLFARYRANALQLSLAGLGVLGASVFVLYGLRRGAPVFFIPCIACLFTFGLFGLTGRTLNLFHLLGAFLGVCLSHNYAIFSAENALRRQTPPVSIRLSALTTAASFGVLALSSIPVVVALGSTVALIVLTALVLVELDPFRSRATALPA